MKLPYSISGFARLQRQMVGPGHAFDLRSLADLRAWVVVFVGAEVGYVGEVGRS